MLAFLTRSTTVQGLIGYESHVESHGDPYDRRTICTSQRNINRAPATRELGYEHEYALNQQLQLPRETDR